MKNEPTRLASLNRARDLAGGVSVLGKELSLSPSVLDAMIHDKAPIPSWLFLKVIDYIERKEKDPGAGRS